MRGFLVDCYNLFVSLYNCIAGLSSGKHALYNRHVDEYNEHIGVPTFFPPVFPAKDSPGRFSLMLSPLSLNTWASFPIPGSFIDAQQVT